METLSVAHFGDVHIGADRGEVASFRRYVGKRILGTVNLRFLGRGGSFSGARDRFKLVLRDIKASAPNLILSSGDFSAMSFPVEFKAAASILREELGAMVRKLAVIPGNHDRYTLTETMYNIFEDYFGEWMVSDLRRSPQKNNFPIVRKLGQSLAFLFVDVVRFHPVARGRVTSRMLRDVKWYLDVLTAEGRTICLVLHYPPVKADGTALHYTHRCVKIDRLVSLVANYRVPVMLTGHVHANYIKEISTKRSVGPLYIINAGSATYRKASTWNLYRFEPGILHVEQRQLATTNDGPPFQTISQVTLKI